MDKPTIDPGRATVEAARDYLRIMYSRPNGTWAARYSGACSAFRLLELHIEKMKTAEGNHVPFEELGERRVCVPPGDDPDDKCAV